MAEQTVPGPPGAGLQGPGQARRGPAPFASFDHETDEVRPDSSPESKQTFQLPEILEGSPTCATPGPSALCDARGDARSDDRGDERLGVPAARARSHSSPAVTTPRIDISRASSSSPHDSRDSSPEAAALGLEDAALELRASTEELVFLEQPPRRASTASRASAASAASARLSVTSRERSPSPHKMLLETSFCGPKPIDTDAETCSEAVERRLMQMQATAPEPLAPAAAPVASSPAATPAPLAPLAPLAPAALPTESSDKERKETHNAERRRRPQLTRDDSYDKPEVFKSKNLAKNIIRIRLKPASYEEDEPPEPPAPCAPSPRLSPAPAPASAPARDSRSPSPLPHSRKSSFCSLFRSRETIASPESPAPPVRCKRGAERGRSASRERAHSAGVLALFRRRRSASPRAPPPAAPATITTPTPAPTSAGPALDAAGERLMYYEDTRDGVIHIPLKSVPADAAPPTPPATACPAAAAPGPTGPLRRTVLPDGSIIIPLRSPTDPAPPIQLEMPSPPATLVTHDTPIAPAPTATPTAPTAPAAPVAPVAPAAAVVEVHAAPRELPAADPVPDTSDEGAAALPTAAAPDPGAVGGSGGGSGGGGGGEGGGGSVSRRSRLMFSTQVGSGEQVFSTQLSFAQTPSAGSDASAPGEDDTSASSDEPEQRGLVGTDWEELPYVPTTLPQERSLVLPMVPISQREPPPLARRARPRAPPAPPAPPPPAPPPPVPLPTPVEKLHISLPPRSRPPATPSRGWVDFADLPERRQPASRIQTLPGVSYVEPEHCRCECHAATAAATAIGTATTDTTTATSDATAAVAAAVPAAIISSSPSSSTEPAPGRGRTGNHERERARRH